MSLMDLAEWKAKGAEFMRVTNLRMTLLNRWAASGDKRMENIEKDIREIRELIREATK